MREIPKCETCKHFRPPEVCAYPINVRGMGQIPGMLARHMRTYAAVFNDNEDPPCWGGKLHEQIETSKP